MKNPRLVASLATMLSSFATVQSAKLSAERRRATLAFAQLHAEPFALLRWAMAPRQLSALALLLFVLFPKSLLAAGAGMALGQIRHLRSYDELPVLNVTPATDAGRRLYVDLEQNRAMRYLQVRMDATVQVATVNAAAVRNFGMIESLYSEMGITGGGDGDIVRADPMALRLASDWQLLNSASPATRLTSPNIATTSITGMFRIWLENPRAANPRETLLLQKEPTQRLQFFATLNALQTNAASSNGSGRIVDGTGTPTTVVTLTNVRISLQQVNNTGLDSLPLFRPRVSQIMAPIAATIADYPIQIPVESTEYLRGISILQLTATDTADGQLLFSLMDDNTTFLGQGIKFNSSDYNMGQAFESGGETATIFGLRGVHYDFQQEGRLSNLYSPGQGTNLRLLVSVTAPPAGYFLLIVKHSLMRDKYINSMGRMVVVDQLPAELAAPAAPTIT